MTKSVHVCTCVHFVSGGAAMATNPVTLKSVVLDVRAGLAALAAAHDDNQRRHIVDLLGRESATLAEQCQKRNNALNAAYDWIESHRDDPEITTEDLKAREERWLLSLRQYEVAMDLLGQALEAVRTNPAPAPLAANPATPPTQEALL